MRKVLLLIALTAAMNVVAKTTYIPTYRNYLHIVTGSDTLAVTNNLDTLELVDTGGMFTLRIDQEDVTHEKVKAIKRAKRAAGWATFAVVMGGISTAFSDNSLQYMVRSTSTYIAATLADIYKANANEEQTLEIDLWIDNTSGEELMVCDLERGLTWWIQPRQSMRLKLNNPEATNLRISDPHSRTVRFANALAGSKVTKWELGLDTEDHWYVAVYKENDVHKSENIQHYIRIDKRNYEEKEISTKDFWQIKKAHKGK